MKVCSTIHGSEIEWLITGIYKVADRLEGDFQVAALTSL